MRFRKPLVCSKQNNKMELTEKHAELVGLHYGDGSLIQRKGTNKLRFQLRGDAITDKAHYDEFIIPLCNELIGFPLFERKLSTVLDENRNSFGVSIESPKIAKFFKSLGIKVGKKTKLKIPAWILQNEYFSNAFVRGLFDTDGCIYYGTNHTSKSNLHIIGQCIIACVSEILMKEVSKILNGLEIKHRFKKRKNNKKNEQDYFVIEVRRPHHKRFMKIIGSHNPKHLSKFQIAQKFGFCPPRTTPQQRANILKGYLDPFSLYL